VPTAVEYGATECVRIAEEWPDRTLRVRETWFSSRRCRGRTAAMNRALGAQQPSFPLLRYALDDMTDAALNCPDQGFSIFKNVVGRNTISSSRAREAYCTRAVSTRCLNISARPSRDSRFSRMQKERLRCCWK